MFQSFHGRSTSQFQDLNYKMSLLFCNLDLNYKISLSSFCNLDLGIEIYSCFQPLLAYSKKSLIVTWYDKIGFIITHQILTIAWKFEALLKFCFTCVEFYSVIWFRSLHNWYRLTEKQRNGDKHQQSTIYFLAIKALFCQTESQFYHQLYHQV